MRCAAPNGRTHARESTQPPFHSDDGFPDPPHTASERGLTRRRSAGSQATACDTASPCGDHRHSEHRRPTRPDDRSHEPNVSAKPEWRAFRCVDPGLSALPVLWYLPGGRMEPETRSYPVRLPRCDGNRPRAHAGRYSAHIRTSDGQVVGALVVLRPIQQGTRTDVSGGSARVDDEARCERGAPRRCARGIP